MNARFSAGAQVPIRRVLVEYRRWLIPLGVLLAANVVLLLLVVVPLTRAVQASEGRAEAAVAGLAAAEAEYRAAEAARDSNQQATSDLDTFYSDVLPGDISEARRVTHVELQQLARAHDVTYQRMGATPEVVRDSTLQRLRVSMVLAGEYEDIRAFIYDLETAPAFVVIDNMVLAEGQSQQAPLALTLQLSTFYRAGANAR